MLQKISKKEWIVDESQAVKSAWSEFDGILDISDDDSKAQSLRELIGRVPDHIDAIHHLGVLHQQKGHWFEAALLAKQATNIVLDNLPNAADVNEVCLQWEYLENRPFLRALHSYGLCQKAIGEIDDAITTFQQLINLNPTDNLGGRELLVELAFKTKQPELVVEVCSRYSPDWLFSVSYGYPLALLQTGQIEQAKSELLRVVQEDIHVAKLLHPNIVESVPLDSHYLTVNGDDHAFDYRQIFRHYWQETTGALDLLGACIDQVETQP